MIKNFFVQRRQCCVALLLLLLSWSATAQSIVRVETPVGTFNIELFDSVAPKTVRNFINYVLTDRYDDSIIHRSVPGFVLQGGMLKIPEGTTTLNYLPVGPTVDNEFGLSNTRGTLAMAKVGGDPNSATSQWFVNLADNTDLDTQNGGFTVFGRVQEGGMDVLDTIAALPRVQLTVGASVFPMPVVNFNNQSVTRDNLILMSMSLVSGDARAPNYLEQDTGDVRIKVDGGTAGIAELSLRVVQTDPQVLVQVRTDNAEPLSAVETGFSTFDPQTGELRIPELSVNGVIVFRNLVLALYDANQLLFSLESFE